MSRFLYSSKIHVNRASRFCCIPSDSSPLVSCGYRSHRSMHAGESPTPMSPTNSGVRLEGPPAEDPTKGTRTRVSKACDRCRTKKTKCSGCDPCFRCRGDNAICTYGYVCPAEKRGPVPDLIQQDKTFGETEPSERLY
jgi:hypothetical protein